MAAFGQSFTPGAAVRPVTKVELSVSVVSILRVTIIILIYIM